MSEATPSDVTGTIEIARNIVKVQGNIFIKELLRQKKRTNRTIKIGVTKEEMLENLVEAIEDGAIVRADLDAWVQEVEGWGKQHVYLYRATAKLVGDSLWNHSAALIKKLTQAGLVDAWNSTTSLTYPEQLTLASIKYANSRFEAIWHERFDQWNRDKEKDGKSKIIDGDLYEFRAYRQQLNRSVSRFVLVPSQRKAALFLQIPLADARHENARRIASDTLAKIFSWEELTPVSISKAIKSLDQLELDAQGPEQHGQVQAQNTKFAATGATVEFDADPGNSAWKSVPAVRRVRRALEDKSFTGASGMFRVQLRPGKGLNRDVVMWLNGKDKRVFLHSQMTADEVWIILDQVLSHSA